MTRILHIASRKPSPRVWIEPFIARLKEIGELTILEDGNAMTEDERAERIREYDILVTCWEAAAVPVSLAKDCGALKYICNVSGTVRKFIPIEIVDAGIPVTNWGDAIAGRVAEGAFALLMACLKNLSARQRTIRSGGWKPGDDFSAGMLEGLKVGIYGYGVIGRRFVEMLRPFRPEILIYDPYVTDFPEDCVVASSLDELFSRSEAVVIHAGLSDETRGSVTAGLLAKLPDNGIVINTARGGIVDQDALFAELQRGRLRAGLDVLEPDRLPTDHPARQWENLILTAHCMSKLGSVEESRRDKLDSIHLICLDNIRRFLAREALRFVMDRIRYERST